MLKLYFDYVSKVGWVNSTGKSELIPAHLAGWEAREKKYLAKRNKRLIQRKFATAKPQRNSKDVTLVGRRVKVFWSDYDAWYSGVIVGISKAQDATHCIQYDDDKAKGLGPIRENLNDDDKGEPVIWELLD